MLLYFIITNFIINIIFLGIIIYFIITLSNTKNNKCTLKSQLRVDNKDLVSSKNKSNVTNSSNLNDLNKKENKSNVTNSSNLNELNKNKKVKFVYDQKKCFECIKQNQELGGTPRNCPHCGSENYDTGCIPSIVKEGKPNNCVPKHFTPEQAFLACNGVSDSMQPCNLIHPKYMLQYQKEECKRSDGEYDYYCAYDESDSCSHNICYIDDYYSYGSQSICDCQKVPHENLPEGYGRECIKGNGCKEFYPLIKAPELLTDPGLQRFYNGYATYMDVPALNTWNSALISNVQPI